MYLIHIQTVNKIKTIIILEFLMFLETRQHKRDLKQNDVAYLWIYEAH